MSYIAPHAIHNTTSSCMAPFPLSMKSLNKKDKHERHEHTSKAEYFSDLTQG